LISSFQDSETAAYLVSLVIGKVECEARSTCLLLPAVISPIGQKSALCLFASAEIGYQHFVLPVRALENACTLLN
jgi:hypothetical protein